MKDWIEEKIINLNKMIDKLNKARVSKESINLEELVTLADINLLNEINIELMGLEELEWLNGLFQTNCQNIMPLDVIFYAQDMLDMLEYQFENYPEEED